MDFNEIESIWFRILNLIIFFWAATFYWHAFLIQAILNVMNGGKFQISWNAKMFPFVGWPTSLVAIQMHMQSIRRIFLVYLFLRKKRMMISSRFFIFFLLWNMIVNRMIKNEPLTTKMIDSDMRMIWISNKSAK